MKLTLIVCLLLILSGCKPPEDPALFAKEDATEPQTTELVKAEAGVGKQGQVIGDQEGFLSTPVKAMFKVKQQAAFLKVEKALQLYEAAEGHKPKSQDEFMDKIIKFNRIELPELPEGQEYVWDADAGQLMVEKPTEK